MTRFDSALGMTRFASALGMTRFAHSAIRPSPIAHRPCARSPMLPILSTNRHAETRHFVNGTVYDMVHSEEL